MKTFLTIFFLFLSTSQAFAEEKITFADIYSFGWEYIGETVSVRGIITELYAARMGGNKGHVAAWTMDKGIIYGSTIFEKKFKSRQLKPFLDKCVRMTGRVKEIDTNNDGVVTKTPSLLISEIELADSC